MEPGLHAALISAASAACEAASKARLLPVDDGNLTQLLASTDDLDILDLEQLNTAAAVLSAREAVLDDKLRRLRDESSAAAAAALPALRDRGAKLAATRQTLDALAAELTASSQAANTSSAALRAAHESRERVMQARQIVDELLGLEEHVVAHRVRIGLEEVAVPFRVERVEGEPDAIVPEGKGVALFAIADDLLRVRVPAAKADEEGPAIGHDPDLGPLGRRVTGDRKDLRELVDEAAVQPAGVVHHAVDHGRAFRKAEGDAMVGRRTDPVVAGGDRDRGRCETDEEAEPRDRPSTR